MSKCLMGVNVTPEVFNEIIIITLVITFITVPIRCAQMKPEHTIDDKSDSADMLTNWEHKFATLRPESYHHTI